MSYPTYEATRTGDYVISDEKDYRSRDVLMIGAGEGLKPGTVLGRVTASSKFYRLNPEATDGSQIAAAILQQKADAATKDVKALAHVRRCTVTAIDLLWPSTITAEQQAKAVTDLAFKGIVVRA